MDPSSFWITFIVIALAWSCRAFSVRAACRARTSLKISSGLTENMVSSATIHAAIHHLAPFEEKEKAEMDWLVKATNKVLSPVPGDATLSVGRVRRIQKLMRAWGGKSGQKDSRSPLVVELLLERMKLQEKETSRNRTDTTCSESQPVHLLTVQSYNILLQAWSQSRLPDIATKCRNILKEMDEQSKINPRLTPNSASFNACIKSCVRDKRPVEEVRQLLSEMRRRYQGGNAAVAPVRRSFNFFLYALANAKKVDSKTAKEAFDTLRHMRKESDLRNNVKPDVNTYLQVMTCVAKARPRNYEDTLDVLLKDAEELLQVGPCSGFSNKNMKSGVDLFNAYMGGWLHSDRETAMEKILQALGKMEISYQRHSRNGDASHLKPNLFSLNTVLSAYKKFRPNTSVDDCSRVRSRLRDMYDLDSDIVTFNILLECHSQSGQRDARNNALQILSFLESSFQAGNRKLKPDSSSYRACIDCTVKSKAGDAAEQAEELLRRMTLLHRNHGGDVPSVHVYNALLNAFANSPDGTRGQMFSLLKKMEKNSDTPSPDVVSYNTVLTALISDKDIGRAQRLLNRMESGQACAPPDSQSYGIVVRGVDKGVSVQNR